MLTILVVAHHSALAYTTFARFESQRYIDSTHPIVDSQRNVCLDIFQNFNDIFFMSLMFFIGGLFLHKSINKKGVKKFIEDRFYRLFIPFLFVGTILMLIAHVPAYLMGHNSFEVYLYLKDFFIHEKWPVGPPWFIGVLFIFNVFFAFLSNILRRLSFSENGLYKIANRPFTLILVLIVITWILYVPLALKTGSDKWGGIGPFEVQLSRILLYFGYFLLGAQVGLSNMNSTIFYSKSIMLNSWKGLIISAIFVFGLMTIIGQFKFLEQLVQNQIIGLDLAWIIYYTIFACSCSMSCLAIIYLFRKKIAASNWFWNSLSQNAYMIYLLHYVFVIWMQFGLTNVAIFPITKFLIVFVCSLILSWCSSIILRKNKWIAKYL